MEYILIILLFTVFILKLNKAKINGILGERYVAKQLLRLDETKYKVINNLMIKTSNGTSQIDHVVISIYGIFVIETKNYKGWIIGNENDEYWKQVIYKRKEKLRNPIRQNYGHIKTLKECLGQLNNVKLISIIAFGNRATLKVNTITNVVYSSRLRKTICNYTDYCMNFDEVVSIYNRLLVLNIDSKEMRKEHVANVRSNIAEQQYKIRNNICPRCGGSLVERSGRSGSFIGCSSFPKCRYTKNK